MKEKHIHMLGICGTGMGTLAGLLKAKGYEVSGSDQNVYPPMSDELIKLGVKIHQGYSEAHIAQEKPDLVVIGNVIRRENPEAQKAISDGIPYRSMPEILKEEFLTDKKSIVVTGTHGKTTTTALISWLLYDMGYDPSFLIGGIPLNFDESFRLGKGEYFVIEGDEYDTAFFDKGPKFLHYNAKYVIITSLEFDHADIYRNREEIEKNFIRLVKSIPEDGVIIANFDDPVVKRIVAEASCRVKGYSTLMSGDYNANAIDLDKSGSSFSIDHEGSSYNFHSPSFGRHNLQNTASAISLLTELEMDAGKIQRALAGFRGVKRRQELLADTMTIKVIDDFAHHPTAIRETISAVRQQFPDGRIWAVFEPRSNTSRRNIFQDEFVDAFKEADRIIIAPVFKSNDLKPNERLDVDRIIADLSKLGKTAFTINKTEYIIEYILRCVSTNDVILVMSNGGFDNIHKKLIEALKERKPVVEE